MCRDLWSYADISTTALPRSWGPLNETEKTSVTTQLRTEAVQALRDLSPGMGAYANEADPTELCKAEDEK
jgi:hypothetical protein